MPDNGATAYLAFYASDDDAPLTQVSEAFHGTRAQVKRAAIEYLLQAEAIVSGDVVFISIVPKRSFSREKVQPILEQKVSF